MELPWFPENRETIQRAMLDTLLFHSYDVPIRSIEKITGNEPLTIHTVLHAKVAVIRTWWGCCVYINVNITEQTNLQKLFMGNKNMLYTGANSEEMKNYQQVS